MAAVLESTLGGIGSLVSMPIRSYLTRLIRDQLLHYVREDCIDMQRISLGGTLVLHNLELKLDVLRSTYAARAAALTDALRAALPEGATVTSTEGGFFCWLQLPEGVRAEAVIAAAMAHEIFPVSALPGAWGNARPFHCAICFRRKTITCQDRLWTH